MGKLLSLLRNPNAKDLDVFVDFENAKPTAKEEATYEAVEKQLILGKQLLNSFQRYNAATVEIREAINNPETGEVQRKAWAAVSTCVKQLKSFYDFSRALESIVTSLLSELCSPDMTSVEHLEQQQALFRQFAEILDFTLAFDEAKTATPAMQNDFSYYKRKASHMKTVSNEEGGDEKQENGTTELDISSDMQGRISLFFAEARPMMKCVSDTTSKFVTDHKEIPLENTTDTLANMATICREMITTAEYRERLSKSETISFILRVMAGVLILYDHVHPNGAFASKDAVDMERYVKVLKQYADGTNLLEALKYTTKHFNDAPENVKKAFL